MTSRRVSPRSLVIELRRRPRGSLGDRAPLGLYRLVQLDEARIQRAVLLIAVACGSGQRDGEAADPSRCRKVARAKDELIAELPVYLGVSNKADAVTAEADRAETS